MSIPSPGPVIRKGVKSRHSSGGNLRRYLRWKMMYVPLMKPVYTKTEVENAAAARVLDGQL